MKRICIYKGYSCMLYKKSFTKKNLYTVKILYSAMQLTYMR